MHVKAELNSTLGKRDVVLHVALCTHCANVELNLIWAIDFGRCKMRRWKRASRLESFHYLIESIHFTIWSNRFISLSDRVDSFHYLVDSIHYTIWRVDSFYYLIESIHFTIWWSWFISLSGRVKSFTIWPSRVISLSDRVKSSKWLHSSRINGLMNYVTAWNVKYSERRLSASRTYSITFFFINYSEQVIVPKLLTRVICGKPTIKNQAESFGDVLTRVIFRIRVE
jgi:hypothetical protein